MKQTVTIKASNLLIHSALLVLIGGALIVLQIINNANTSAIKRSQTVIEERVIPVCLDKDTLAACVQQIRDASDRRVRDLCQIVHERLDLPVADCIETVQAQRNSERPSGNARAGPVADQADPGGPSASSTSTSATSPDGTPPVTPTSPTDPGTGGGGGTGGGTGGGGGGGPPGETPPAPASPDTDNGTCVLNQTACINIQGDLDDDLLPDHIDPPGLNGAAPPGLGH